MATFDLPITNLDETMLDRLVANSVSEGRRLDYKERLPGSTDGPKRDFLIDVASFANAAGGDLIYGMKEERDADGKPTGEPDEVVGLPSMNLDAETLRLSNLADDGLDPRVPRLDFHKVPRQAGPPCLVVRVPKSLTGLHMVTFKGLNRFYGRTASRNCPLESAQIAAGFIAAATRREAIARFRRDRVARIVAGESAVGVQEGPVLIFHAIPLEESDQPWASFRNSNTTDVLQELRPLDDSVDSWNFNLDGFVVRSRSTSSGARGYLQLYHDGSIETVDAGVIAPREVEGYGIGFSGHEVERAVIDGLGRFQRMWKRLEVSGPAALGLAASGVEGMRLFPILPMVDMPKTTFDREVVIVPEVVVDEIQAPPDHVLEPLFEWFWNAAGWGTSPHYRKGKWRRSVE